MASGQLLKIILAQGPAVKDFVVDGMDGLFHGRISSARNLDWMFAHPEEMQSDHNVYGFTPEQMNKYTTGLNAMWYENLAKAKAALEAL